MTTVNFIYPPPQNINDPIFNVDNFPVAPLLNGGLGSGTGPTGAEGPTGPFGGPTGPTGSFGPTGAFGGPIGPTGYTGVPGPTGSIGPTGSLGQTGATGLGKTGPPGATGPIGPTGTGGVIGHWGSFWSTEDQENPTLGNANVVTYDATDPDSNGVSIVDGSKITVSQVGVYDLQFSIQIDRTSGFGTDTADIWLAKNGSVVPDTNTRVTVSGGASAAKTVAAWNFVLKLEEDDYLELYWSATDTNIILHHEDGQTSPTRPAIPSVIATLTQVMYTQVGPTGSQGSTGQMGLTGSIGIQGPTGPTGIQGIQGPTGNEGSTGSTGIKGDTGPPGIQGIQGVTGPMGLTGDFGPTGMPGTASATGSTGPPGAGIILGGLVNEVLTKNSNTNYDTYWSSSFTGTNVFADTVYAGGYRVRSGTSGAIGGNRFNFNWTGSSIDAWIDTSNFGDIRNSSVTSSISTANAVGSYAFLELLTSYPVPGGVGFGATVASTYLSPTDTSNTNAGSVSGTWRCMGRCSRGAGSLFVRIS